MRFLKSNCFKNFVLPASLLSATIIGAGFFSLPYITSKAGWLIALIYLIISPIAFYFLHTMYADIILRSGKKFKFAGFAKIYLGKTAYYLAVLVTIIGSLLTLSIYIILGESFRDIIFPVLPAFQNQISLLWIIGSALIFINPKKMARLEFLITAAMIFIIFLIFISGAANGIEKIREIPMVNLGLIFLPFGPFLFSFSGRSAVPAIIDYGRENKIPAKGLKKVFFWGTIIPALAYFLFIIGIIGISKTITGDSVESITALPYLVAAIIGVLGLLSILSSYIVIGLSTKEIMEKDLNFPKIISNLLIIFSPWILILAGLNNFIEAIAIAGGIFLALEGVLIIMIWKKMNVLKIKDFLFKKRPKGIITQIILFLSFLGIIYAVLF
ncbi:MAG: aromatic amino acid transport family protein [Candidatus Paceibacterota bacterium]